MKNLIKYIFIICLVIGVVKKVDYISATPGGGFMGGGGTSAYTIVYLENGNVVPVVGMHEVKIGSIVDVEKYGIYTIDIKNFKVNEI